MSFGENLRFLMDSKDIQRKELAYKTGISENTIKSYLKGDGAEPTIAKAVKIADVLGVTVEELAEGHPKKERAEDALKHTLLMEAGLLTVERLKILIKIVRDLQEEN